MDIGGNEIDLTQLILTIVLLFVVYSLFFDGNNDFEDCVSDCIDDTYSCIWGSSERYYEKDIITEYNARMCYHDLNNCELGCR